VFTSVGIITTMFRTSYGAPSGHGTFLCGGRGGLSVELTIHLSLAQGIYSDLHSCVLDFSWRGGWTQG